MNSGNLAAQKRSTITVRRVDRDRVAGLKFQRVKERIELDGTLPIQSIGQPEFGNESHNARQLVRPEVDRFLALVIGRHCVRLDSFDCDLWTGLGHSKRRRQLSRQFSYVKLIKLERLIPNI